MTGKRAWMVGLVLLGLATTLSAQPAATTEVKASIAEMQEQLDFYRGRLKKLEDTMAGAAQKGEADAVVQDMAKEEGPAADLPTWLKDLSFFGDLRLRYEAQMRESRNMNGKDRHRGRFRLRFGFKKLFMDKQMEVGFRLASSDTGGPTSTNQTLDTAFTEKLVWIDRAYAMFTPKDMQNLVVVGGKFANPFFHTDMVWDSDVCPEGIAAVYKPEVEGFTPFITGGYLIVDEDNRTAAASHDTVVWALQVGSDLDVVEGVKWTTAGTYYLYDFHRGTTGAGFLGAGTVDDWHVVNLTSKFGFELMEMPASLYVDLAHNCGESDPTPRIDDHHNAYAVGLNVGQNKKEGDVSAGYKYAYIGATAVPALNDADFGFNNTRGHSVCATYSLAENVTIGGKLFYVKPIVGSYKGGNLMFQADLVWSF
jgi:putative porin